MNHPNSLPLAAALSLAVTTARGAEPLTLPEITVTASPTTDVGYVPTHSTTATKTDTPLIETPQSISVITRDRLAAQDADNLGQALRYTAGVTGEAFGVDDRGYDFAQIRGFDATTYRDGLPVKNLGFAGFDFRTYAAERIEILRGPASVLYGQGAPGGLVNYVSKRPLAEPFRELVLEAGSFDRYDGKFDLSGPLDRRNTLSYRLTGLGSTGDHQVNFIEDDRLFVAPGLTWTPSTDTTFTVLGYYQRDDLGGASNSFLPASGTVFSSPNGRIPPSRFTGEPSFDSIDRAQFAIGYLFEHRWNDTWTFRQNLRYEEVDVDFEELFGLGLDPGDPTQRFLLRDTFAAFADARPLTIDNHAQAQFATGPLSHTLLFGVDYQHVDFQERIGEGLAPAIDIFNPVYGASFTLPPPLIQDTDQKQQQIGLYFQDQIKLYDKLVLVLGGRHDSAETETDDRLANVKTEQDDREFTGRAGLVYLSEIGLAPYFSYAESFLPTLGTNASSEPFKPETGRQYEVGVKYQLPDTNAFVTLAAFDLRRQNVLATDPGNPNDQVQTGEVRSRGIEVEGVASFDFGLDVIAAYTYLDVDILENSGVNEGNRPDGVAKQRASLWADYTLPGGALAGLGLGMGVRYVGSTFGDQANSFKVDDYTLVDAAMHYDWGKLRFAVNAQNLFDDEHIERCFSDAGCFYGQVRKVTASIRYRW